MRISDWSSDVCSSDLTFFWVMVAVVAGYVLQRVIEGLFIKDFGMDIHVWQKFDSDFRLVTARRNPNFAIRSEEHMSELQSLMRISYAVFCLKKKITTTYSQHNYQTNIHHEHTTS